MRALTMGLLGLVMAAAGESAVCLAQDKLKVSGGCWTPASALNGKLIDRLVASAGLTFAVIPVE